MKAMGVTAGVPDIFMAIPNHDYHGLFLELKSENGTVSDLQRNFMYVASQQGYYCAVTYGLDDAIETIKHYLGEKIDR